MAVDFPIGTRLTIDDLSLEVVADKTRVGCDECAMDSRTHDDPRCSTMCGVLYCMGLTREDETSVHWERVEKPAKNE